MKWTSELQRAGAALVTANPQGRKYREYNDQDIRARAREFGGVRPGYELQPHQVEYLECLVQRLEPDYDPSGTHGVFVAAYRRAHADA